ncbi:hypothetical protein PHYBOEH_004858 [Phytophthora boehmeriae]|uniref:C2 domain-containing protein n=1 Tax=Phytophthora boehmeriae TaxID=109152 RepID=A0A8T1WSB0_9STRA|nr:hypothetical protein PHYBOEH_004858 [Phytophthora boehmeriae]
MSSNDSFNLSVSVFSVHNLAASSNGAYCTMIVWTNPPQNTPGQAPKCTSLRYPNGQEPIAWNEEVDVNVANPQSEVLTVRIKDREDSLIGSCNIYLAHLGQGKALDQWFQLHPVGHIHLKLVMTTSEPSHAPVPPPVNTPSQPTTMMEILQSIQQEQQKVFAQQLRQSQAQQHAANPFTADFFQQMEREKQKTYDQINEQLRLYRQQQNLNYMAPQQQHPGFAAGGRNAAMFGQQQSGQSIHQMADTAANIASIASNLQQLSGNGGGTGAAGLGLGAMGLFFGS